MTFAFAPPSRTTFSDSRSITTLMLLADLLWIILAFSAANLLRYGIHWAQVDRSGIHALLPFLAASCLLWIFLFYRMRLDGFRGGWRFSAISSSLFLAVGCQMIALFAAGYLTRRYVSRLVLLAFGVLLFFGFVLLRSAFSHILRARRRSGNLCRLVIAGSGTVARELALKIDRHPEMLCEIVGFLFQEDQAEDRSFLNAESHPPVTVSTLGVVDLLCQRGVHELMLALPSAPSPEVLKLAVQCRERGIGVSLVPQPYELYLSRPKLLDLDGLPILHLGRPSISNSFAPAKRILDITLAAFLSLFALPLVLMSAAILRISKGRAFRWETRCGRFGHPFSMLRLNVDRDSKSGPLYERFLVQLSISELPQLWNVLRGEMSLVGPRPESFSRTRRYTEWQEHRLRMKPGITGLAQVYGLREQSSSEDKTRYDLQYLLHSSLTNDVSLLVQTVSTLALRLLRSPLLFARGKKTAKPLTTQPLPASEELYSRDHRTQPSAD